MANEGNQFRGGGKKSGGKPGYGKPGYGKPEGGYDRGKPGYGKPGYGKSEGGYGKGKPGYGKPEGEYGKGKPGYGKPGYGKSEGGYGKGKPGYGKGKPGYGKPEGEYGKGKPGYGKPGYGKSEGGRDGEYRGKRPYGQTRAFDKAPEAERRSSPQAPEEVIQSGGADELPYLIIGRNAVREAVKSGRSIDRILVQKEADGSLHETVNLARDRKILIREVERKKLDELCLPFGHGQKTANHQGIVAYAAGVAYCEVADILSAAQNKGEAPFVIVLDGVQDPHNLGAIIRSADCAGAHGIVIGKRRSASVTAATVKAAAGATEHVAIARVTNIAETLKQLKAAGLWIAGADMEGPAMASQRLSGPLALVVGGEGEGLTKLVRERCDYTVSIPISGHVGSLNASVAAAVLMFEKRRQDGNDG